jgi:mRNA interferase RelE/StbE
MKIVYAKSLQKDIRKLDKASARHIKSWIAKNLEGIVDPRSKGKALTGNLKGLWRYRIGDYRLIAEIKDDEVVLYLLKLAHRKEVYK